MITKLGKLDNKIAYAFEKRKSPIAHLAIVIKCGTRYEPIGKDGLAHFMEHGLFKGTLKRKAYHILSGLDAAGGELNAYTTKEDLVLYASFLKSDLVKAMDLMSDMLFRSVFSEKDIETEKDVVIDELKSYADNPGEQIMDDLEGLFFKGQALGKSILGTEECVKSITQDDLLQYRNERFKSENISIGVVGNFTASRVTEKLNKYFGVEDINQPVRETYSESKINFEDQKVKRSITQSHVAMAYPAANSYDKKRYATHLISNYLAGPALNSRLVLELREKRGIAYHVESNYQSYDDTGVFTIYFGTDAGQVPTAQRVINRELKKLCTETLGPKQLSLLKKQLKGHLALSDESGANVAIGMARSLVTYKKIDDLSAVYAEIDAISADEIRSVSMEIFMTGKASIQFIAQE